MPIHLRFYHERYNMDVSYYTGDVDVRTKVRLNDLDDLKRCWNALLCSYEGETYSAWLGRRTCDYLLCGGAFDPNDIQLIEQEYNQYMARRKRK